LETKKRNASEQKINETETAKSGDVFIKIRNVKHQTDKKKKNQQEKKGNDKSNKPKRGFKNKAYKQKKAEDEKQKSGNKKGHKRSKSVPKKIKNKKKNVSKQKIKVTETAKKRDDKSNKSKAVIENKAYKQKKAEDEKQKSGNKKGHKRSKSVPKQIKNKKKNVSKQKINETKTAKKRNHKSHKSKEVSKKKSLKKKKVVQENQKHRKKNNPETTHNINKRDEFNIDPDRKNIIDLLKLIATLPENFIEVILKALNKDGSTIGHILADNPDKEILEYYFQLFNTKTFSFYYILVKRYNKWSIIDSLIKHSDPKYIELFLNTFKKEQLISLFLSNLHFQKAHDSLILLLGYITVNRADLLEKMRKNRPFSNELKRFLITDFKNENPFFNNLLVKKNQFLTEIIKKGTEEELLRVGKYIVNYLKGKGITTFFESIKQRSNSVLFELLDFKKEGSLGSEVLNQGHGYCLYKILNYSQKFFPGHSKEFFKPVHKDNNKGNDNTTIYRVLVHYINKYNDKYTRRAFKIYLDLIMRDWPEIIINELRFNTYGRLINHPLKNTKENSSEILLTYLFENEYITNLLPFMDTQKKQNLASYFILKCKKGTIEEKKVKQIIDNLISDEKSFHRLIRPKFDQKNLLLEYIYEEKPELYKKTKNESSKKIRAKLEKYEKRYITNKEKQENKQQFFKPQKFPKLLKRNKNINEALVNSCPPELCKKNKF